MKKIILITLLILTISCQNRSVSSTSDVEFVDTMAVDTAAPVKEKGTIDSAKIKELKKFFRYKKDEFDENKITWITPLSVPKFVNRNALYCYFGKNETNVLDLRFRLQYYADDWLFIENCEFLIDGKPFKYIPTNLEKDNGDAKIWEWFDDAVDYTNKDIVEALSNAKTAKVKINGSHYFEIVKISPSQILNIKRAYDLYIASGGTFSSI